MAKGIILNIRKAVIKDSAGLQQCMELAYSTYLDRMNGKPLPPMEVNYSEEIEQYPTWVIDCDGKIAGGIIIIYEEKSLSIANVSVHPDFQGRGFGSILLNFAGEHAKENNYKEMRLATHVLLTENISLYRHLGWEEYDRDNVRVYMKKVI